MNTSSPLQEEFQKLLGPDRVLSQQEDLVAYSYDGTAALSAMPEVVVLPTTAEEVRQVLLIAQKHRKPVVTRGSGTGLSGGSVPVGGGVVLCLTKFNRILELDRNNLTLLVEPGATTQQIAEAASAAGLFYPPDPGSMKTSTIGGNVAYNSGGLRGLKYGVTRDYVMGMEVVLADGTITWLGSKCVKDVAGLSLKDLFIGSEGILGVITKVLLSLIPIPAARETMLAVYDNLEKAAQTVSDIIAHPVIPCTLEFLDKTTMEAIAKQNGALRVQRAKTEEERLSLAAARRTAFSALARRRPTTILEDVTVPRSELAKLVRFIQEAARRHQVQVGTFGHFGDGNVHPTFLTDERDKEEMERVGKAMDEIFDYTLKLKGTITGEHGVGLAKKPYLPQQFDEGSMGLLRQIKKTIDPENLLNPGKIFDVV